jgi:hypothetical protein
MTPQSHIGFAAVRARLFALVHARVRSKDGAMSHPRPQEPAMTAVDARTQLRRLQVERLEAFEIGLGANAVYMASLDTDIASSRSAYIGLAITELATLRAQLSGPQIG